MPSGNNSEGDNSDGNVSESSTESTQIHGKKSLLKLVQAAPKNTQSTLKTNKKHKSRVLLVASRGVTQRFRHFIKDLTAILPHSKTDSKVDDKTHIADTINATADLNNCNNAIYFETRKHTDLYMWLSRTPAGPSVKFIVKSLVTMEELKMVGNALKGSRHIISFSPHFDSAEMQVVKLLLLHSFAVPTGSRKVKPFIDHVLSFSFVGGYVHMRNYQIVNASAIAGVDVGKEDSLVEIGPRCCLEVIRIFDQRYCWCHFSFQGSTLYENENFITPNAARSKAKMVMAKKYSSRQESARKYDEKMLDMVGAGPDPLKNMFQ